MSSLPVLNGLSPQLVERYRLAKQRFLDISNASRNGTPAASTPTGQPAIELGSATPTCSGSRSFTNDDLLERLARLATAPKTDETPPLVTYTETATENGVVVSATPEFRRWMRSRYPGYGTGSNGEVSAPPSPPKGVGGKPRFKQNTP